MSAGGVQRGIHILSPYPDLIYRMLDVSMSKTCEYSGCSKHAKYRGYCISHYDKLRYRGEIQNVNEMHGKRWSSEYTTWASIKTRCYNHNYKYYHRYGGRGITVCDRWLHSFNNFNEDMGDKPFPKAQIDRINNDGNYCPENCHWVTPLENSINKSTVKMTKEKVVEMRRLHKQENVTQIELAKKYNLTAGNVWRILHYKRWVNI